MHISTAQARVRERVCEIIEKEFSRTTHAKESEIETIEDRLLKIKKALHVVRYGAVVNYYAHTVAKVRSIRKVIKLFE